MVSAIAVVMMTVVVSAGAGFGWSDVQAARVARASLAAEPLTESLDESLRHRQWRIWEKRITVTVSSSDTSRL
jgi:hypothetical protein